MGSPSTRSCKRRTRACPYSSRVIDATLVLVSYILASISFPYWIARAKGIDLRAFGSRKLGGSNLAKAVTPLHGVAGGLLDGMKGFAAVVLARALGLSLETQLLCGLAAIALIVIRRLSAGLADDLATGASPARVMLNRALFDRSELQERGLVAIT